MEKTVSKEVPSFVIVEHPARSYLSSIPSLATTFAYWEEGVSNIQSEFIPVYASTWSIPGSGIAEHGLRGGHPGEPDLHVAACRPRDPVRSYFGAGHKVGQDKTLNSDDATKKLTDLGMINS